MRTKTGTAFLIVAALLMVEGALVASFFVFLSATSSKEPNTEVSTEGALPSFMLPSRQARPHMVLDRFGEARAELVAKGTDFLEINFSQDKVFKYEKGIVVKEAAILAKGDPQGWGGTPAGLYQTLAKHEDAFSGISQVYMPFAVYFYGKYYLHGVPYYPWGEKLASGISGGCIRLEDALARQMYELVEQGTPVFVVDKENDGYLPGAIGSSASPLVSTASYLVADVDSGFVFAEKNSQDPLPIASLTKLLTALVVAENIDLRKSVEVTAEMLAAHGDTEDLEEGEHYRVVELFYPLLVASSNDAAEAVAGFLGREGTVKMMNDKARAMLLTDTRLVDPSGFDPGNIATAQDLFYLARYIANNRPPLFEITRGKKVRSFGEVRFSAEKLWNKNIFAADSSFVGGKAGYIGASKHTGVFLFEFLTQEKEVRTIAFVLLGSEDSKRDTQRLYSWLQQNYQLFPHYSS